jgi:3-deoxy-manno-octulosonate cytidylyltransferase (CMP-KDO synthetase)
VDRVVETLLASPERRLATLAIGLPAPEAADPNVVKVVVASDGRALYFSRSPVPHFRVGEPAYRKHLGLYAYRADALEAVSKLPPSPLERAESLEQLRWLEAGYAIWVGEAATDSIGIDTPEDLARAENLLKREVVS